MAERCRVLAIPSALQTDSSTCSIKDLGEPEEAVRLISGIFCTQPLRTLAGNSFHSTVANQKHTAQCIFVSPVHAQDRGYAWAPGSRTATAVDVGAGFRATGRRWDLTSPCSASSRHINVFLRGRRTEHRRLPQRTNRFDHNTGAGGPALWLCSTPTTQSCSNVLCPIGDGCATNARSD